MLRKKILKTNTKKQYPICIFKANTASIKSSSFTFFSEKNATSELLAGCLNGGEKPQG